MRNEEESDPQAPNPAEPLPDKLVLVSPEQAVALKDRALWAGVLMLLTLVAYSMALQGKLGFVWDDARHVTENRSLRSAAGLRDIWITSLFPRAENVARVTPQYYPLTHTTYWLEYHLWGADPMGYHIVNVALHGIGAVLLWLILRQLSVPGAWLAAAIFAVHPVHAESVAWVSERKNVLSGVFFFGSILAYLRFAGVEGMRVPEETLAEGFRKRGIWYAVAGVLFICALLSKTVTCTMPVVALLLVWWKRRKLTLGDVLPVVPLLLIGLGLGVVTARLEQQRVGAVGADWNLSFVERCLVAGRALWFYGGKLLWPANLTFTYERWPISAAARWQYLFPAAVAGGAGCAVGGAAADRVWAAGGRADLHHRAVAGAGLRGCLSDALFVRGRPFSVHGQRGADRVVCQRPEPTRITDGSSRFACGRHASFSFAR